MADLGFDGKVAIITGAGGGLGRQHALLLASRGALVVVNDLGGSVDGTGGSARSRPSSSSTRSRRRAARPSPTPTRSPRPRAARPSCRRRSTPSARVDIVINNAGILRDKAFHNAGPDLLEPGVRRAPRRGLQRHPAGLRQDARAGLRPDHLHLVGRRLFGNFGQTNYGAAKMGLVGLTRVLAVEGAKYNIKANAIAPLALTRMTEDIMGALGDRLDPGLVSPLVAYLAHEDCDVSGEIFSVGGGRVARDLHRRDARATTARAHRRGRARPLGRRSATRRATPSRRTWARRRPSSCRSSSSHRTMEAATSSAPRPAPGWRPTPATPRATTAPSCRPTSSTQGVAWQRRLFADGWAGHPLAGRVRRPGPDARAQRASGSRSAPAPACRRSSTWSASCWPAAPSCCSARPSSRQRLLRPTLHGRPGVVPAVQRARRRQRPGRAVDAGRARRRRASSSTARRCGARAVATATGAS